MYTWCVVSLNIFYIQCHISERASIKLDVLLKLYYTCRENGIKYRRDETVGGWFSQIGEMHQVHHLWGKAEICTHRSAIIFVQAQIMPLFGGL